MNQNSKMKRKAEVCSTYYGELTDPCYVEFNYKNKEYLVCFISDLVFIKDSSSVKRYTLHNIAMESFKNSLIGEVFTQCIGKQEKSLTMDIVNQLKSALSSHGMEAEFYELDYKASRLVRAPELTKTRTARP